MEKYSKNRRCRRIGYRRFAAWVLSLAMLLDCIPAPALAEEPDYAEAYQEDLTAEIPEEYPEARELIYDGMPQVLIDEGTASGGTLLYALGESMDAAPEYGYSEELPAGTEAGEYYVWYYAAGDEEHADSEPESLAYPVVIKRREAVVTASDQVVDQGEEPDTSTGSVSMIGAAADHALYDVALTYGSTDGCGVVSISPHDAFIEDEYGNDVTGNYDISYADGMLTVASPRQKLRQNRRASLRPGRKQRKPATLTPGTSGG